MEIWITMTQETTFSIINCQYLSHDTVTARKVKFSIKDFSSKCDQIRSFFRIWSHLQKKSLMENFTFCAIYCPILCPSEVHEIRNWCRNNCAIQSDLIKDCFKKNSKIDTATPVMESFARNVTDLQQCFYQDFSEIFQISYFVKYLWRSQRRI